MAAIKDNFLHSTDFNVYIPKASTDITHGDVVVMPKKADPKSRSRLGALSRISPIASKDAAPWTVGVAGFDSNTTVLGATLYATPTANQAITVYKVGQFDLAIVDTAGNVGDLVRYSSGATGAQLFTITSNPGLAIGKIAAAFTGATANDLQRVELIPKEEHGVDIYFWLENRPVNDCTIGPISGTSQSFVNVGRTFTGNREGQVVVILGKRFRITRDTNLAVGKLTGGATSTWKARMIVARSGGFAYRTCSGSKVTLATFTKTAFSNIYFVPVTQTSGEICLGYVVFGSAVTKATAGMIFNTNRTPAGALPVGFCHFAL